jgi:hypothetical protein
VTATIVGATPSSHHWRTFYHPGNRHCGTVHVHGDERGSQPAARRPRTPKSTPYLRRPPSSRQRPQPTREL